MFLWKNRVQTEKKTKSIIVPNKRAIKSGQKPNFQVPKKNISLLVPYPKSQVRPFPRAVPLASPIPAIWVWNPQKPGAIQIPNFLRMENTTQTPRYFFHGKVLNLDHWDEPPSRDHPWRCWASWRPGDRFFIEDVLCVCAVYKVVPQSLLSWWT